MHVWAINHVWANEERAEERAEEGAEVRGIRAEVAQAVDVQRAIFDCTSSDQSAVVRPKRDELRGRTVGAVKLRVEFFDASQ